MTVNYATSESTRIVSIYGPPAFGKSQVAIAAGHHLKSQGKKVYHIDLYDVHTKDDFISALLRFCSNQSVGHYTRVVDFLLQEFRKIEEPKYFILDNADHLLKPEVKDGFIRLMKDILTNCTKLTFLVSTTESSEFSVLASLGQKEVRVESLDNVSSQNLVQKWLPEASNADCKKIAQFCGHVPILIRVMCNAFPQNELPLSQAIDNFIRSSDSVLSRLDNPEEIATSRLSLVLDSSYQTLSQDNKEAFVSLSVIPGTFDLKVAAAVLGIAPTYAEKTLRSLHRKALIDAGLQPGTYKVHRILQLFGREKGEQEMSEVILNSNIRFFDYFLSLFNDLNERFFSEHSLSACFDFHENKQSIVSSLIQGCSESATRNRAFNVLISGVLCLDTLLWSDRVSFNKIYDSAISEAKKHGNIVTCDQLVLAKAFSEVTWGIEEAETLQLFSRTKKVEALTSDCEKGKLSCYFGVHQLANGRTAEGVKLLEDSAVYLRDACDPFLKILKVLAFQILSLYYKSEDNLDRAVEFYKRTSEACEEAANQSLLVIQKLTSSGCRTNEERISQEENLPLVLEVNFLVSKAAKIFSSTETMKIFENDVLQTRKEVDAKLSRNSKAGLIFLHQSIVGVLAEMTGYEEAIRSIQAVIERQNMVLSQSKMIEDDFSAEGDSSDQYSEDNKSEVEHKEALARNYSYLSALHFRMEDYKASLESQNLALDIRRELYDERHPEIADSYHELGIILRALGNCNLALHFQQLALDIRLDHCGENPSKTAASYHELGVTQCKKEEFSSALRSHESALKIRLENLDEKHRDIASSYHELGITQWYLEKYESALDSHNKARSIALEVMGKYHSVTANSYHELGKTHFCLEDYRAALRSHHHALRTRLDILGEQHSDTADSFHEIGVTLFEMECFSSALQYHMRSLKTRQLLHGAQQAELFGENHPQKADSYHAIGVAQSYHQLGRTQCQMGNYDQAFQSHKCALSLKKRLFGEDHMETADSYDELGKVSFFKRNFSAAFKMQRLVLGMRQQKLDGEHKKIGDNLYQLGLVQKELEEYEKSLKLHQHALHIRMKRFGENHTKTADSYYQVGIVQYHLERYNRALDSHLKARRIREKLLDNSSHTEIADSHLEISKCQVKRCVFDLALRSNQEALKIRTELLVEQKEELALYSQEQQIKKLLLQDHAPALELYQHTQWLTQKYSSRCQTCDDYDSLKKLLANFKHQLIKRANDYYHLGSEECMKIPETHSGVSTLTAGLRLHQQALVLRLALLGEKYEDTAQSHNDIGVTQNGLMDYTSALESHQRALDIRLELFGENHKDTAASYTNIGVAQINLGDYTSALESHQRALDIRLELFGENHKDTAASYNNIGVAQANLGDYTSALESHQRALHIPREVFGENHPDTADSYNNIGVTQANLGDYTSALESHQRALHIRRELFGENHPKTANSYHNIGITQINLGDYTSALESHQRALDIRRELFGENHPKTAESYNDIRIVQDNHPQTAGSYHAVGEAKEHMKA